MSLRDWAAAPASRCRVHDPALGERRLTAS
jgi:hypothetical protein